MAGVVMLSACERENRIVVTETRELTTKDKSPKLFATSNERFRDTKPSPVKGETPEGWLALPPATFRLLNYRFGESGLGQVWVSLSSGSVLDNVNRWLGQFGAEKLDTAGLAKLRVVPIAGASGVWVEAEGEYAPGMMGGEPKPGYAMAGVIAEIEGQILTLKMVGPKAEVEAEKPVLEAFAKQLEMVD
jgi:hypothetical protein